MTAAAGRRVVLLHGLWMPGASMHWLASQLRAQGFSPRTFNYHGVAEDPAEAASRLSGVLLEAGGADIVAHSLGGLVALHALRERPGLPVARVVCLGSPLAGSGAAAGMARWAPGGSLLGRSANLLHEGVGPWTGRAQVGSLAGRVPHGLGALFAGFAGEHDGTVAVDETRIEGLADHVVVDASHTGLLFSAAAAEQAGAFLREGRFRHG
jgi:pimeloyl-ACP methyl ester carboxylesterase